MKLKTPIVFRRLLCALPSSELLCNNSLLERMYFLIYNQGLDCLLRLLAILNSRTEIQANLWSYNEPHPRRILSKQMEENISILMV